MTRLLGAEVVGRRLPRRMRDRVFEAAYHELLGDFLVARRDRSARFSVRLKYELRAVAMALACWRLLVVERIRGAFAPAPAPPLPSPDPRKGNAMESFKKDLQYAVRQLFNAPVFSATAILIVAIAIGANTAAFSVVNAMLLRPQPFASPEELVDVYQDSDDGQPNSSSFPAYRDIAAYDDLFSGAAATFVSSARLQRGDTVSQAQIEFTTSNYLEVLGLRPSIGRWFTETEGRAGAEAVAVLSHRTWREQFGADPGVLGTVLRMNGAPVTVVGVGPQGYNGYLPVNVVDAWVSLSSLGPLLGPYAMATLDERGDHWFFVKARLREGVTPAQAQEALNGLAARLAREFPEHNTGRDITVFAAGEVRIHPEVDPNLMPSAAILMTIVGLVLLLACSNLANLLLVRAAGRGREISIRAALGASRVQVIRQLLTESVLLSVSGGVLGVLLAAWAVRGLMAVDLPLPVNLSTELGLDVRVLGFAVALSVATGVLFGLAPALRAARPNLAGAMREDAAPLGGADRKLSLRNALVVVQVAISFVLLAAAGLFIRSLGNAQGIETGFAVDGVEYLQLNPGFAGYDPAEARNVMDALIERVRALPGVEDAALATLLPVTPRGTTSQVMEGYEPPSGQTSVEVPFSVVDARYFETLRVPLLHGRTFASTDNADSERVVVVNEAFARRFWGDSNAVDRRLRSEGAPDAWRRVVGVVGDAIIRDLTETTGPQVYYPWTQSTAAAGVVLVRNAGPPGNVVAMLREEVRAIDADIPVLGAGTMQEHLSASLESPRLVVRFLSGFGAVALILASLGLYGVVSFAVGRRMVEVGVRMALGARSEQVLWLVLRDVGVLLALGVALGIGLSLAANTALAGMLFGVSPADPLTLAAVAVVLMAVALVAGLIPAMRAARADPLLALRNA